MILPWGYSSVNIDPLTSCLFGCSLTKVLPPQTRLTGAHRNSQLIARRIYSNSVLTHSQCISMKKVYFPVFIYIIYITNHHCGLKEEKHAHLASSMLHQCSIYVGIWYPILCTSSGINSGQHNRLRKKAPNKCVSSAVHVDNGFWRHPKFAWLGAAFKTIGQICDTRSILRTMPQCRNCDLMRLMSQYRTFWKDVFSRWNCKMSTSSQ